MQAIAMAATTMQSIDSACETRIANMRRRRGAGGQMPKAWRVFAAGGAGKQDDKPSEPNNRIRVAWKPSSSGMFTGLQGVNPVKVEKEGQNVTL